MEKSESIFIFIQDERGRILLVLNKREEKKMGRFTKPVGYGLPGGSKEPNETQTEALWRELKEETGLTPEQVELNLTDRELIYYESKSDREVRGGTHWVFVFCGKLKVPADSVTLQPVSEADVEKAEWLSIDDLPENLYRSHRMRIDYFLRALNAQ